MSHYRQPAPQITTVNIFFSIDLNYDPALDAEFIENEAEKINDYSQLNSFRRHARLWLRQDFESGSMLDNVALEADYYTTSTTTDHTVEKGIKFRYKQAKLRTDVKSGGQPHKDLQLPQKGMIVRLDYCFYGHFFILKNFCRVLKKFAFTLIKNLASVQLACRHFQMK